MATLKDRLFELYEEKRDVNYKIGRTAFAEKCGITRGKLDGYLRGNGEKLWKAARTIAKNNQVSVSWLIGETDIRFHSADKIQTMLDGLSPEEVEKIEEYITFLQYQKNKAKNKTER